MRIPWAFRGTPQILRLNGKGETVLPGAQRWDELLAHFPSYPGIRQIILASIHLIQTSCGYGVPLMELQKDREILARWATSQGEEGLVDYRVANNSKSLGGLPTPWHSTTRNEVGPGDTADDRGKAQTRGCFSCIVFSVERDFCGLRPLRSLHSYL